MRNYTRYELLLAESRRDYGVRLTERDREVLLEREREVRESRAWLEAQPVEHAAA